jgi:L-2-hydroxycarboxylate dehydrogenase (NAD+)
MAIRKARRNGLGMVVARRSTHYGIAGYYAMMATDAGMIGITGTNARPSIAPTFGVENMLGTNPLTFGIPTNEPFPFVLDCATSVTQRGKIELYERAGRRLSGQWVIDRKGRDVRDAKAALAALVDGTGALTPIGGAGEDGAGYKGYGYATVVEILSSALQSGNFMKALSGFKKGKPSSIELGHFFMAVNVESFTGLREFRRRCGDILKQLRRSAKAPGERRIYTAGEKEHLCWLERRKTGIPVTPAGQKDLSIMRNETGLKKYVFPWD